MRDEGYPGRCGLEDPERVAATFTAIEQLTDIATAVILEGSPTLDGGRVRRDLGRRLWSTVVRSTTVARGEHDEEAALRGAAADLIEWAALLPPESEWLTAIEGDSEADEEWNREGMVTYMLNSADRLARRGP